MFISRYCISKNLTHSCSYCAIQKFNNQMEGMAASADYLKQIKLQK